MLKGRSGMFMITRRRLAIVFLLFAWGAPVLAQRPTGGTRSSQQGPNFTSVTLIINVRDTQGAPMEGSTIVTLVATAGGYNQTTTTRDASSARFEGISPGDYDVEARYPGYRPTTEHISVSMVGATMQVYLYLSRESDERSQGQKPQGIVMSPKLQAEMDKGLEALRKLQYEIARVHFAKGLALSPGNADLSYLLGMAELGLNHTELARKDFEHALSIDPGHERSLLALGELQLREGETSEAIITLEKAFLKNGAGWRTHLLLASAYFQAGRMAEAEPHAQRAVELAHEKSAGARLLLAEIQQSEGKLSDAQAGLQDLAAKFPKDPSAAEAKKRLATLNDAPTKVSPESADLTSLPAPVISGFELFSATERTWAPLDIDSREYPLAQNTSCSGEEILSRAELRLKTQLKNFEKFTATEHIEHQEIDRLGRPGPVKSRDFSYIVFVNRYQGDSFFLDEDRYSNAKDSGFPTSLATTGLNNLGVAILQPANRGEFVYKCEGLASIRGKATWQIRFEETKESRGGIREWQRNGKLFQVPLKGRVWISSTSFDVLRIETDLLAPVQPLGLTRDHLLVDYGPVDFATSTTTLWLPWSAEMHMELHGHRYHHKHYLTDYMLFEVDTNHKIGKPKEAPAPATQAAPAGDPGRL
ncbi:MAG TPA: tetratricopeptide repeat protein [Candidatus Sulfotelmatobacter sp.]|nr:tetratricopeptide repeat protein [Candidatus Sulfotelmatobacter sp.]